VDRLAALGDLNVLALVVAALSYFAVGGLWFSPLLFSRQWQSATGLSDSQLAARNPAPIFGGAFVASLVSVIALGLLLGSGAGAATGAVVGLVCGIGFAAMALVTIFAFEARPARLLAIDAGYHIVAAALAGLIIGAWQ
jgi:hypothetical protein